MEQTTYSREQVRLSLRETLSSIEAFRRILQGSRTIADVESVLGVLLGHIEQEVIDRLDLRILGAIENKS